MDTNGHEIWEYLNHEWTRMDTKSVGDEPRMDTNGHENRVFLNHEWTRMDTKI